MITIHLSDPYAERDPLDFPDLTMAELFRKPRVVGDIVLLEPRPGVLINLAHIELIYDTEEEGAAEQAATDEIEYAAPLGVEVCHHGYIKDTCSICTPAFTGSPQYRGKP